MQRITITIDDDLLQAVDDLMHRRGYGSRSEAMRDIIREMVDRERLAEPDDRLHRHVRLRLRPRGPRPARRLNDAHHERHDLSVATMHVHLNHESCLEVSVLRGPLREVRAFADGVASQRGVRNANLHLIPAQIATEEHVHGDAATRHEHVEI